MFEKTFSLKYYISKNYYYYMSKKLNCFFLIPLKFLKHDKYLDFTLSAFIKFLTINKICRKKEMSQDISLVHGTTP
jgi:hypothetical protein